MVYGIFGEIGFNAIDDDKEVEQFQKYTNLLNN